MLFRSKQKQIKPSRLAGSKQKDTVQKALQKQAKAINARIDRLPDVARSEERRVGKSVDLGGRRIIKKKKKQKHKKKKKNKENKVKS